MNFGQFEDKFIPHLLNSKYAALIDETPKHSISSEIFKKVTGSQSITAQDKGKTGYQMACNFRIMVAANELLKFDDTERVGPLSKRQYYIPFDNIIDFSRIGSIIDHIHKNELPAIFNKAIVGLKKLETSRSLPILDYHKKIICKFEEEQDSVIEFFRENYVFSIDADPKKQTSFYENYKGWCKDVNRRPFGRNTMYKKLLIEINKNLMSTSCHFDDCVKGDGNSRMIYFFKHIGTDYEKRVFW
jgi:phage/plasmid-associated DNA primase